MEISLLLQSGINPISEFSYDIEDADRGNCYSMAVRFGIIASTCISFPQWLATRLPIPAKKYFAPLLAYFNSRAMTALR